MVNLKAKLIPQDIHQALAFSSQESRHKHILKFHLKTSYSFSSPLYNIVLVLPHINMNPPRVYTCSQSQIRLPPAPLHHHLSGSSQCTSPKHPVSCIEPGLAIISYMIVYMFQCHSPKSSHLRPLPQSPKDCSIYLCLFCCLTYRVIITFFLNSIYMG